MNPFSPTLKNSHYDWNVSRLVLAGNQLVHHWGVWGYQMRLETIQLKVGGIGAVVTHPDYRKQNLMHQAAQESFDAMKRDGYDLSILRGRHYVKMGYARAWNYATYRFKLEDFPLTEPAPAYQPLGLEGVPEMDALYNQTHAAFTGTALRPTYPMIFAFTPGVTRRGDWPATCAPRPQRMNPKPCSVSKPPATRATAWRCWRTCSSAAHMERCWRTCSSAAHME